MTWLEAINPTTTSMMSAPKRAPCNGTNSLYHVVSPNAEPRRQDVRENFETLSHSLEPEDKGTSPIPDQGRDRTPAPSESIAELLN